MLRIFHQYRPRQVARYVKGFFRGRVYIEGVGAFEFELRKRSCCRRRTATNGH